MTLVAVHKCPCDNPDCDGMGLIGWGKDEGELQRSLIENWDNVRTDDPESPIQLQIYELRETRTYSLHLNPILTNHGKLN